VWLAVFLACSQPRPAAIAVAVARPDMDPAVMPRPFCDTVPLSSSFFCRGDWAVRYDEEKKERTLMHAGAAPIVTAVTTQLDVQWPASFEQTSTFDWNGDGSPELQLTTIYHAPIGNAPTVFDRAFVTFEHDAIVPYAPAVGLPVDHTEDLDKDGRPDLVLGYSLGHLKLCFWGEANDDTEVFFAAHALPDGRFALGDAVARDYAKKWCPTNRAPIFQKLDSEGDLDSDDARCARVWGMSADEVKKALERACQKYMRSAERCEGRCRTREWIERLASFDPPLDLSKP